MAMSRFVGVGEGDKNINDDRVADPVPQSHHGAIDSQLTCPTQSNNPGGPSTVDPAEVARFSKLSDEWWDPNGKMAPLHKINPLRLGWIRDTACRKFNRNPRSLASLQGLAHSRHRLRRGPVVGAAGAARRPGDRHRSVGIQHRGGEGACRPVEPS